MYKRKQLINEIANKVFEHLLLEVGEGVKPYDFEVTNDSKNRMEMTFTIPPDTEHDTPDVIRVVFDVDVEMQGNVQTVLSFKTITGGYEDINRNQVYKTMSTVMACVEYFLQKRPYVDLLIYIPADKKREKLYNAYLKKALQNTKLGDEFEEFKEFSPRSGMARKFNSKSNSVSVVSGLVRKFNPVTGMSFKNLKYKKERKELRGADLRLYPLNGAYLQHAQLQHANLQHVDFQFAKLQHAQLQHANLQDADLYKANLQGADLTDVKNLETCKGLDTVKYDKSTIWPEGFDITEYQN